MCSKEVKKLKTILSINNCNERLGKIFQTRDKYFFYDLGTGKIFECTFEEYKIFEKILSSKDNNELEKMFKSSDINVLSELLDSIEKENLLQAHPDVKAVFCQNDEMALGASEAIKTSGKDIVVVGFDGNEDAISAVEDGSLSATVAQKPKEMGKLAIETAIKYLKGETVDEQVDSPLELVK